MNAQILDNGNLQLFLPKQEQQEIKEQLETHGEESVWYDLFEPYYTNGEFTPVNPESHYIGLTSDPYIIAEEATTEDNGDLTIYGKIWHYPNYMLHSVIVQLINGKTVELILFDEVEQVTLTHTITHENAH